MPAKIRSMRLVAATVWCALAGAAAHAGSESDNVRIIAERTRIDIERSRDLASKIGAMYATDQIARRIFLSALREAKLPEPERKQFEDLAGDALEVIDSENTKHLKALLKTHSWPEIAAVDKALAENAWSILQHSGDLDFQKSQLPALAELAKQNVLDGFVYANLADRVALSSGMPQTFGTQVECHGGEWAAKPLADPGAVERLRREYGLRTLQEQKADMESLYGACAPVK